MPIELVIWNPAPDDGFPSHVCVGVKERVIRHERERLIELVRDGDPASLVAVARMSDQEVLENFMTVNSAWVGEFDAGDRPEDSLRAIGLEV